MNAQDSDGVTSLFVAAEEGHLLAVKALVELGADAKLCANDGASPLTAAEVGNHAGVVKYLSEETTRYL